MYFSPSQEGPPLIGRLIRYYILDIEKDRKATLQALHTLTKAVKSHERNVVLDGCPLSIRNSEKDLTRNERSTKIRILWTHGLPQEQNQEGCKPQCLCRLPGFPQKSNNGFP